MIMESLLIEKLGHNLSTEIDGAPAVEIIPFRPSSEFHVGMLSISLLIGLAYTGFVSYTCWKEQSTLLSYIRNLMIALVLRTFFTLLFDSVIILGDPLYWKGSNTLSSFECICTGLVIAYWLLFNIYIHACCQRNFNNEPSLHLVYTLGVPGIAVFYSLAWIFAVEGQYKTFWWWFCQFLFPVTQWIEASTRLLFLLIQLGLLINMGRLMIEKLASFDNDSKSLLWKIALLIKVLTFIFWLRFGLSVGRPPLTDLNPYLYFYYFIDGIQCAAVCPIFYFLNIWVAMITCKMSSLMRTNEVIEEEVVIGGKEGIVTISSIFETQQRGRREQNEETKDIVYSSVLQPENFKKTIDLYKRLNILPKNDVVIDRGEEFYDCYSQKSLNFATEEVQRPKVLHESNRPCQNTAISKFRNHEGSEMVQKKNAFYSSKYLIVEQKDNDPIPKYLETRPSATSTVRERAKCPTNIKDQLSSSEMVDPNDNFLRWLQKCTDYTNRSSFESMHSENHKTNTDLDGQERSKNNQPYNSDKKLQMIEKDKEIQEEPIKNSENSESSKIFGFQSKNLFHGAIDYLKTFQEQEKLESESKPPVAPRHVKTKDPTDNEVKLKETNNPTHLEMDESFKKDQAESEEKIVDQKGKMEILNITDDEKDESEMIKNKMKEPRRKINDNTKNQNIKNSNEIPIVHLLKDNSQNEIYQQPEEQIYDVPRSSKEIMKGEENRLPEIQFDSESEFDIEKKSNLSLPSSISSTFSLDNYYTTLLENKTKFENASRLRL